MIGITYNGKHSYKDFGLIMHYFVPQMPSKKKVIEDVPFMNGDGYDFSKVATNGETVYTGRDLACKFTFKSNSKAALQIQYSRVSEWLLEAGQAPLIPDSTPDIQFLAEVIAIPTWSEIKSLGRMELTFRAEPFKQGINLVNEDIPWDTFNFEVDSLAPTSFVISGNQNISIYNPGRVIVPKIRTSSEMVATLNGYTANLGTGDNMNYGLKLLSGSNIIAVAGIGTIEFIFRREML